VLDELRCAREFTRAELSRVLTIEQGFVGALERGTDIYICTLRRNIEAMGGSLQIRAIFPHGKIQVSQFQDAE
jgi:hypothetical protein